MVERGTETAMRSSPRKKRASSRPRQALRYFILRVILLSQGGEELSDPPGRDLLLSSAHTFADLAAAIDRAFARWDRSHLHEFRFIDGRRIVMPDPEEDEDSEPGPRIDERVRWDLVGPRPGETFTYLFDFGDRWEHRCTVLRDDADPDKEWGGVPREIVPIFGWGAIPDQYGRASLDEEESEQ